MSITRTSVATSYAMPANEGAELDESGKAMQETMSQYQRESMRSGILCGGIVWMGLIGYLFWIRKHFFGEKNETLEES